MNKQQQKYEKKKTVSVMENVDSIIHKPMQPVRYKGTPNFPLLSTTQSFPDYKSSSKPHLPSLKTSEVGHPFLKKTLLFHWDYLPV